MSYQSNDIQIMFNDEAKREIEYDFKCVCCGLGFDSGHGVYFTLPEENVCVTCLDDNTYLTHFQQEKYRDLGIKDNDILNFKFRKI